MGLHPRRFQPGVRCLRHLHRHLRVPRNVAAAETPKVGAVSQPGNWYIALDDGTGIEQHTEIAGDITLHVGIVFPNADDGHNWRVDHIDPVARTAHAVRAND